MPVWGRTSSCARGGEGGCVCDAGWWAEGDFVVDGGGKKKSFCEVFSDVVPGVEEDQPLGIVLKMCTGGGRMRT